MIIIFFKYQEITQADALAKENTLSELVNTVLMTVAPSFTAYCTFLPLILLEGSVNIQSVSVSFFYFFQDRFLCPQR